MSPKVVVITGCSSGIGLETAVLLANDKDGRFKVFATMRNLAKQDQLKLAAGATLDKSLFILQLDVTKEDSITDFVQMINEEEGGVDILINNAGIGQGGVVENVTMQQIRTVYEINVIGLIRLTQTVIHGMKAKKSGHIINISSVAGVWGFPFQDVYVSSKFAVEGFSESLAPYLQQFNISVSVIEPGPVHTEIFPNMNANKTANFDSLDLDADPLTQQLQKKSTDAMTKLCSALRQPGKDVAGVIQEAILSDRPHFRYQTSEASAQAFIVNKCKDPTGDSVINSIVAQNGWEK